MDLRVLLPRHRLRWVIPLAAFLALAGYGWWRVTPNIGELPVLSKPSAEEKLWTFGFVGDTQLGEKIYERIFAEMDRKHVEFVLHLGDMVDDAANQSQWQSLIASAARHRIRLMPVVGNHDKLLDYDDRGEIGFRQFFPSLPSTFYHFRHRGINFLMLNSERSFLPGSEQAHFLRWQLEHRPGTTIVCLHRPVFTAGRRDLANQLVRRMFLHDALRDTDTVAVLAGHHHYYDRTLPLDGITYVVSGGSSPKLYGEEPPRAFTAAFHAQSNHYGLVDVYADRLQVRVVDLDGKPLDEFALALRPTAHELGTAENPLATELPPLAELPEYSAERLPAYTAARGSLPRAW
jgi:predicted phosphodiesterase